MLILPFWFPYLVRVPYDDKRWTRTEHRLPRMRAISVTKLEEGEEKDSQCHKVSQGRRWSPRTSAQLPLRKKQSRKTYKSYSANFHGTFMHFLQLHGYFQQKNHASLFCFLGAASRQGRSGELNVRIRTSGIKEKATTKNSIVLVQLSDGRQKQHDECIHNLHHTYKETKLWQ